MKKSEKLLQLQTIFEIGKAKAITLSELENILELDKKNMSRVINNLAFNGLIIRSMKPEDRKYVKIILTNKAKKIYEQKDQLSKIIDNVNEPVKKNECC
ncbi:MarR family transcriptional regulator [Herbivorax sp. ANBcel31]|uniref:MarR family winged helix-turn-helix transcriptional regulator n=1 Tax=Herbivorax sp. ANBcel31 TaxID=3069754 RepID=UPI0027B09CA0|nr:MarR family transcriptional regulator [Herbivorax sp. ANBcel31]MDQ2086739.1 MarR family transcriptional regulator [Herbivorax sp. ANBcel31]